MSFWKRLLGEDPRAAQGGDAAILGAELADAINVSRSADAETARQNRALSARIDRLELVLEGVIHELERAGSLDIKALKSQIRRLDLLDGTEDARMSARVPRRLDAIEE